jgi:hypothetical protein
MHTPPSSTRSPSPLNPSPHAPPRPQRDAYDVCSTIPSPKERSQCYTCFGIDGDRMMAYYDAVLDLERALTAGGGGSNQGAARQHEQALQQRGRPDTDEFHSATASMAE